MQSKLSFFEKLRKYYFQIGPVPTGLLRKSGFKWSEFENIIFNSALFPDENYEVEQQCQDVIIQMEGILGESLQKYF